MRTRDRKGRKESSGDSCTVGRGCIVNAGQNIFFKKSVVYAPRGNSVDSVEVIRGETFIKHC